MPENTQEQTPANLRGRPNSPIAPSSPPHIPDHELLRRIGSGSYGEVWLARSVLGTLRAVKIVHRQTFERVEHFEREFKGMQKFEPLSRSHEGLVDILQIGRNDAEGYFYYGMELADASESVISDQSSENASRPPSASSLNSNLPIANYSPKTLRSEIFHRGGLPVSECIGIGLALTKALQHLHSRGLVHRDIKPSNIIFVDGAPKLADIGLVAHIDDARSLVGTAGYIPPEGSGTAQADLYSLGKVLYEISLGKDRQDFPQLPPDLQSHPDHAGLLELNEVILKACETDPRRRYASAEQLHADLLMLQRGQSVKHKLVVQRRFHLGRKLGLAAAAVMAVVALLPYVKLGKQQRNSIGPVEINSIAVLPFVHERIRIWSQHEYLSDMLTDEATQAFTNIVGLRVATRQSSFAFKSGTNDVRQIGAQLGVRTVLAGSLKKSSNQLCVTTRLIDVRNGTELWSATYDRYRSSTNIRDVATEVVTNVARVLSFSVPEAALARMKTNFARKFVAYQLYSQASRLPRNNSDGINKGIELLNRALVEDPGIAAAYADLADCYQRGQDWLFPPAQAMMEARKNARQAVQLDDSLGNAHLALGYVYFLHDLDLNKAKPEFQRAIELTPRSGSAYGDYATVLSFAGRFDEAERVLKQGNAVDPRNHNLIGGWCYRYYHDRHFEECVQAATRLLELHPKSAPGLLLLARAQERLGRYEEALATTQRLIQVDTSPDIVAILGMVHARMGHRGEAEKALQEVRASLQSRRTSPPFAALILLALGKTDRAIEDLQQAINEYPPRALGLKNDPFYDELRSDPRVIALLQKTGLKKLTGEK